MRMQPQQPQQRTPSRALRRAFGWGAIVAYVLAVVSAVPPPHTSLLFGLFTTVAFISFALWLATIVSSRRSAAPRLPGRITAQDVYLEQERLRQQAARDAGATAARVVGQAPDQINGIPVLGIVIRDDLHMQAPVLLPEVARRDRFRRILLAIAGYPPRR